MTTATLRHNTTALRARIAELAKAQRAIHAAYALPHTSDAHKNALMAIEPKPYWAYKQDGKIVHGRQAMSRDGHAEALTALHVVLAQKRGKEHLAGNSTVCFNGLLLEEAEALVVTTEVPASEPQLA